MLWNIHICRYNTQVSADICPSVSRLTTPIFGEKSPLLDLLWGTTINSNTLFPDSLCTSNPHAPLLGSWYRGVEPWRLVRAKILLDSRLGVKKQDVKKEGLKSFRSVPKFFLDWPADICRSGQTMACRPICHICICYLICPLTPRSFANQTQIMPIILSGLIWSDLCQA